MTSVPVKQIKSICPAINKMSSIKIIRNRMFYARPGLNAKGSVKLGLQHIRKCTYNADDILTQAEISSIGTLTPTIQIILCIYSGISFQNNLVCIMFLIVSRIVVRLFNLRRTTQCEKRRLHCLCVENQQA